MKAEQEQQTMQKSERQDIYARITAKIVASLEQGVRPWMKPWSGENAAARITRPLRHNGAPYSGINILVLWASAIEQGFKSHIWMTFRQALELKAHVRKGEKGSLVVYANSITKTAPNDAGEEVEREIHFLKGYTVFNIEQIECLPKHYHVKPEPKFAPVQRIEHAETFFAATPADVRYGGGRPTTPRKPITSSYQRSRASALQRASMRHSPTNVRIGPSTRPASNETLAARTGVTKVMPWRSSSPNWALHSCAPI